MVIVWVMKLFSTTRVWISFVICAVAGATLTNARAATDKHIVVVVWDGMRPDFVTEQNTPTLWALAQRGVFFRNHHSVYPSVTNVNGTAIATGAYPDRSGIIANHEFRPAINSRSGFDTADGETVHRGDSVTGNKYVAVPTIAQLVRQAGGRTMVASSKTIGLLLDRQNVGENSITFFAGDALPPDALGPLVAKIGPFPKRHLEQDGWTTRAVVDLLWKESLPECSIVWFGEPDLTQHETAPGSPAALAAVKSSDQNLGRILTGLEQHHALETTDIFVVSDHGFSTIERAVDLRKILKDAGFDAVTEFAVQPKPGQIMMAMNGGTILFYVIEHDDAMIHRLVEFLQQSDFAGVIFTRKQMDGTFAFDLAKIDAAHAPDVEMAFRWNDKSSQFGVPGMIDADWQREAGKGTHATLSRFDMHNTLIAAGPDFRRGFVDELPTGNVDLAPSVLRILRIEAPSGFDGRVLTEAMMEGAGENTKPLTQTFEATKKFPSGTWRQSLKMSRVGSTVYLDEGNGKFTP